jgi:cell pole-organizing protein PopZ
MDEILASIRRIIESNDPVPQTGLATGMAEPEGFSGDAANDDSEDVPLTVDEVYAQVNEAASNKADDSHDQSREERDPAIRAGDAVMADMADAIVPPAQPQKSLSLADVAARVRAASERNPGLRELTPKASETVEPATNPLTTSRLTLTGGATAAAPAPRPEPVWTAPVADEHMEIAEELMPAPAMIEDVATPSLISTGTGQQVARSFQDLAVAVDQAERRSFDEIAEDLLRPMLQEWLDDNLPTLVERLVREEIERVARGPRR